ncbi:MAG: hypothetical protein ACPLPP_05020 [Caldisericum exile]
MRSQVKKMIEWNKKHITRSRWKLKDLRIDTTEATILANQLLAFDPTLFIAFMVFRLKMDLGFTRSEICNFTGLTPKQLIRFMNITKNLLYLKVFDILKNKDIQEEIYRFRRLKMFTPDCLIGIYKVENAKKRKRLGFSTGFYERKLIKKWKFFHNNTYEHFKKWFGDWREYEKSYRESDISGQEGAESQQEATENKTASIKQADEGSGS